MQNKRNTKLNFDKTKGGKIVKKSRWFIHVIVYVLHIYVTLMKMPQIEIQNEFQQYSI